MCCLLDFYSVLCDETYQFLLSFLSSIVHNDANPFGRANQTNGARLLTNQLPAPQLERPPLMQLAGEASRRPMVLGQPMYSVNGCIPGTGGPVVPGTIRIPRVSGISEAPDSSPLPLVDNHLSSRVDHLFQQHSAVNTQLSYIATALGALAGAVGVTLPQQATTMGTNFGVPPQAGQPAQGSFTVMPQAAQRSLPPPPGLQSPWGQTAAMAPPPTAETTGTPRMPRLEEAAPVVLPGVPEHNSLPQHVPNPTLEDQEKMPPAANDLGKTASSREDKVSASFCVRLAVLSYANCYLLCVLIDQLGQQQKQIAELSRQLAQQNRELAQQKAGNQRLKEQVGDLSTLQIIQVAKKTQKKPAPKKPAPKKPAGTKKGQQKRKTTSSGQDPPEREPKKKVGWLLSRALVSLLLGQSILTICSSLFLDQAAGSAAKSKAAPPTAAIVNTVAGGLDNINGAAAGKTANPSRGSGGTPELLRGATKESDDDKEASPMQICTPEEELLTHAKPSPKEPCRNCGHNSPQCDHDNYTTGYNYEKLVGYFKEGAKYGGYSCCKCYGLFVVAKKKEANVADEQDTDNGLKEILVTSKRGVHMCKESTGECRHMLCCDCFNAACGLVGAECQYKEAIGIGARTSRVKRGCTQKQSSNH